MSMRLLIVDDDPDMSSLTARELRAEGFTVDVVASAEEGFLAALSASYRGLIVDLGLPDRDGLALVQDLRARGIGTPILVLTARRAVEDRVAGLAGGADDYLVKPFALPELRARVGALVRRPVGLEHRTASVANIVVDRDALEAVIGGTPVAMTRKEFALLELLVRRSGHMTPKRMIEEALYGFDDEVSANAIEAHVSRLRKVLKRSGAQAAIETRRGIGYRFVVLS